MKIQNLALLNIYRTFVNSFEVYDSCKYDDSIIVDVSRVNKENKIHVKTTFVNKCDDSNTVYVTNINKENKVNVKRASVNNYNNSGNEKRERRRAICVFVKRV